MYASKAACACVLELGAQVVKAHKSQSKSLSLLRSSDRPPVRGDAVSHPARVEEMDMLLPFFWPD